MAAGYAGISIDTLDRWLISDAAFAAAIKRAFDKRGIKWLDRIETASRTGTWTAGAWLLERTEPESFGRQRLEITGASGGPIEARIEGETPIIIDGDFAKAAGVEPGTRIDNLALRTLAEAFFRSPNGDRPVHGDDAAGAPPTN